MKTNPPALKLQRTRILFVVITVCSLFMGSCSNTQHDVNTIQEKNSYGGSSGNDQDTTKRKWVDTAMTLGDTIRPGY